MKDNSYDFILCNHVLEHIIDDKKAMKNSTEVLKKGELVFFRFLWTKIEKKHTKIPQ